MVHNRISIANLSRVFGGAERHCIGLAENLAGCGFKIQLIVRENGWAKTVLGEGERQKFEIVDVKYPLGIISARRAVSKFGPDLIHCHLGKTAKWIRWVCGATPVVATLHGHYKSKYYKPCSGLICVAPWQLEKLDWKKPAIVIPNFISELNPHDLGVARVEFRKSMGVMDHEILIGSYGRFTKEKDFGTLLRAFSKITLPNFKLVIAGEGPERAVLESVKPPRAVLIDWVDNPQQILPAFDLFVSPSKEESFGLAILEAMNCAIPVVATSTHGARFQAEGGGIELVPCEDPESMARSIVRLGNDTAVRSAMALRAKVNAGRFSNVVAIEKIINFYKAIIEKRFPVGAGANSKIVG